MADIPLALQTAYADLIDRSAAAAFAADFPQPGSFIAKQVRGRTYWYFQGVSNQGRTQKYVGPETPELLERIRQHKAGRSDERNRQTVVSMLVRSAYLPRPPIEIGEIVAALSKAGVFRLRAVLVGTVAYQTYPATLGTRLPLASMSTSDVDVAQFADVSIAVADKTIEILEILRQVDPSFRPVPSTRDQRRTIAFASSAGLRVDFLAPNKGKDTEEPTALPAFGTHAQPLRFLDFLIHDPEPAVLLHGAGVYVLVPAPERYAIHKLIVSRRRREGGAKRDKDIRQAEALFAILVRKRSRELRACWIEAMRRGEKWRQLIGEGLGEIDPDIRDRVLMTVGQTRSVVPGLDLQFPSTAARYDDDRDVVTFLAQARENAVRCAVSLEALEDHFDLENADRKAALRKFRDNQSKLQELVRKKYLHQPIEQVNAVLLTTRDVENLRKPKRA